MDGSRSRSRSRYKPGKKDLIQILDIHVTELPRELFFGVSKKVKKKKNNIIQMYGHTGQKQKTFRVKYANDKE